MSNIRNNENYANSFWDWSFLNDCFGTTGIRVSDLDGAVERKGHLLILETKLPGQNVPVGQSRMFDALRAQGASVLIIWGHRNQTEAVCWWPRKVVPATNEHVRYFVRQWFEWADQGFVPRYDYPG